MNILQRLFDNNEREVLKYRKKVEEINALEPAMQRLSEDALRAKTDELKVRAAAEIAKEEKRRDKTWVDMDKEERRAVSDFALDPLLPEAFALVREASKRTIGMRHFDVQLIGGMVAHDGRVAELKTGEGKTLMATLPLYLNALLGKGSHLVTPNDYLSKFGAVSMGPIYHFLGMTVGVIQGASPETGEGGGTFIYDPEYRDADARYDFVRMAERRHEAYVCDITYGTNNEYGFDYLRDNISRSIDDLSQTELYYAIVDEADSILIDEARTPLIISGPTMQTSDLYIKMDRIIRYLQPERDYTLEEKAKTAMFTEEGQHRVESALGIDNLSDAENMALNQHANSALKAHAVYKKDVDYVVRFNQEKNQQEVVIVDEFTGRLMFGRRWGDGQHQAIEAKEGVKIENESQTYATITYQNYFRLYSKLSGMTGTAKTEEEELRKVYALDVVVVPTNKPMIRLDRPDVIYKTQEAKLRGITREILRLYAKNQPVLVGTRNIESSERLSDRLNFDKLEILAFTIILRDKIDTAKGLSKDQYNQWSALLNQKLDTLSVSKLNPIAKHFDLPSSPREQQNLVELTRSLGVPEDTTELLYEALQHGIPRNILNAKYHEKEAQIISEAGRKAAVTIATNMAGRGVDIILGGTIVPVEDNEDDTEETGEDSNQTPALSFRRGGRPDAPKRMTSLSEQESDEDHRRRADEVKSVGGLFILGTERHESRRIDNQLRGRGGRQGDPGESRFYVSMEDELWRLFGDKTQNPMLATWPEEQPADLALLSKIIERAQKKVEAHNFDIRKNVLNYDDVMNTQREVIYGQRRRVLEGADLRETMVTYLGEVVEADMNIYCSEAAPTDEWDLPGLHNSLNQTFPISTYVPSADELKGKKREAIETFLSEIAERAYNDKEASVTPEIMREIERHWTLMVLDRHWMEHLNNIEYLKEGIGWRGLSGIDPVVLYKKEAFDMFQNMLGSLQDEVIRMIFLTQVVPAPPVPQDMDSLTEGFADDSDIEPSREPATAGTGGRAGLSALATGRSGLHPGAAPAQRPTSVRRVGRNDPCPCGSGKKYKLCHGK